MLGKALDIGEKIVNKRGPETLPENFDNEKLCFNEKIFCFWSISPSKREKYER